MHRIKLIASADGRKTVHDGMYVISCDVDGDDGRGIIAATPLEGLARTFDSFGEAVAYWQRQSTIHPVRLTDGKPNRPLTTYTVAIERIEGGTHATPAGHTHSG